MMFGMLMWYLLNQEEEHEGEESAYTRWLKTNSVHRKELKKKRGACAVDVAKRIITGLRVTEPFRHVFVLDFLVFHYGVGYSICFVYLLLDFLVVYLILCNHSLIFCNVIYLTISCKLKLINRFLCNLYSLIIIL